MAGTITGVENWLPVVGYEGLYEVSDRGRVKSVARIIDRNGSPVRIRERILKNQLGGRRDQLRYLVSLSCNGRSRTQRVHRLVARAFHGRCPRGREVCHDNGNGLDNRATNLRYDTKSNNNLDQTRHGTHREAMKTHCNRGHPLTLTNTYLDPRGNRECRICKRIARTKSARRTRAARRKGEAA